MKENEPNIESHFSPGDSIGFKYPFETDCFRVEEGFFIELFPPTHEPIT